MQRLSGVVLIDPGGRLLLQERDEHPALDPEKWSLAGGHVEDGESHEAAAYRELEEETGISLAAGTLEMFDEVRLHHQSHGPAVMQVFVAATDLADDDVECHEGRQIVFVEAGEVLGLDLSTSARSILPALLESSTYRRLAR